MPGGPSPDQTTSDSRPRDQMKQIAQNYKSGEAAGPGGIVAGCRDETAHYLIHKSAAPVPDQGCPLVPFARSTAMMPQGDQTASSLYNFPMA